MSSPDTPLLKVQWSPLKNGGYISQSHQHSLDNRGNFLIEPTFRVSLWWYIFYALGGFIILAGVWAALFSSEKQMFWFCLIMGGFFVLCGVWTQRCNGYSYCFSKDTETYAKAKDPAIDAVALSDEKEGNLSEIYGLQFIEKKSMTQARYTIYELNVILEDGERFMVLTHADEEAFTETAKALSDYLGVRVYTFIAALHEAKKLQEKEDL